MLKKINFSIVGCGRISYRHATHIMKYGNLVAACDTNNNALKNFGKQFPHVKLYKSIEELLKKDKLSDVINICTPNGLHAKHAIQAFKGGKHVVCEKPMALTVNDCRMMIEEAEHAQKYLFIVKQNRYNPPVVKVKEILNKKGLGKIYSVQLNCFWNRNEKYYKESDWKGTKKLDGGILFTQFSHFIDILYWLFGHIKGVHALANNFKHKGITEFDDTLTALIEFESGTIGTMSFSINSYQKNMEGSITILGEKGTVKIGGQYLNIIEYQDIKEYIIENGCKKNTSNDYGFYQGSMSNHDKVIENVVDVINKKAQIAVSGFDGLRTVEVIQKIYDSVIHDE